MYEGDVWVGALGTWKEAITSLMSEGRHHKRISLSSWC